jgi:peptidoglycan-associated lipoprotein
MDTKDCAPKELAHARAEFDHARHEAFENWGNAQSYIRKADKAADDLLAKIRPCLGSETAETRSAPCAGSTSASRGGTAASGPRDGPCRGGDEVREHPVRLRQVVHPRGEKPILQTVAAYLKKEKGAKILIEDHCDERGTSEYNMALCDRRAHSAKKYLEALGVEGNRRSTVSCGEKRPLDPGYNEEAWPKNRRTSFVHL